MARLMLESGGERREIKVSGPLTVGRSQTAGVYLDDKTLSREHSQFFLQQGRLYVKDLQSKNGTYLNGALLQRAEALKQGDRVKIGTAVFIVHLEAGDPMPAVTAPLAAPPPRAPVPARATATATQTAPPRPRPTLGGPHPAAVFFYRIILLGVGVVVAYLSKGFFASFIHGIHS